MRHEATGRPVHIGERVFPVLSTKTFLSFYQSTLLFLRHVAARPLFFTFQSSPNRPGRENELGENCSLGHIPQGRGYQCRGDQGPTQTTKDVNEPSSSSDTVVINARGDDTAHLILGRRSNSFGPFFGGIGGKKGN